MKKLNLKIPQINEKTKRIALWALIVIVISSAAAIPAYKFAQNLTECWTITSLPGIAPPSCGTSGGGLTGPDITETNSQGQAAVVPTPTIASPEDQLPPAWDGDSRVNLLFMGLDARDWEAGQGAPRSDTMILFTIDPQTKTAGMLSIPRDMWVNIPGYGYSRINTAYSIGEGSKLPGGGPGLAAKTVEQFIGVPVQYYAQVDFKAFEEAIDAMGGLYICIPEKIRIDIIGNKRSENLHPGCQTLHGYQVLGYARNRHTAKGDVDRANRQQQVIMALIDQAFSPQNFPDMVKKAPAIYKEAQVGLRTNLSFEDALKLGVLLSQIPKENIKRGVIDYSMVTFHNVTLGGQNASVFKPIPDKIRVLRDEIFISGGPLSPMANGDPVALMQADAARVRVMNGTYTAGLDERTAQYLLAQGVQQVGPGGYASTQYAHTEIVVYGPKLYTLRYLMTVFGVTSSNQILFAPEANDQTADIEVRVGADWLNAIPAGY